jgi:hypothetical protein
MEAVLVSLSISSETLVLQSSNSKKNTFSWGPITQSTVFVPNSHAPGLSAMNAVGSRPVFLW